MNFKDYKSVVKIVKDPVVRDVVGHNPEGWTFKSEKNTTFLLPAVTKSDTRNGVTLPRIVIDIEFKKLNVLDKICRFFGKRKFSKIESKIEKIAD